MYREPRPHPTADMRWLSGGRHAKSECVTDSACERLARELVKQLIKQLVKQESR